MKEDGQPRRIVIIGAVAAGTSAAAKARRNDESAEIILYEMDKDISYSGCGLPYFIGGRVDSIEELTPRDPGFFREKYQVEVKIRHQVLAIDPHRQKITLKNLSDGTEFDDRYDVLVVATGARPVILTVPGAGRESVFVLRNPGDARAIRSFIDSQKPKRALIIGSGFIGLEMVENLARAGLEITLVEKMPSICPVLDADMAPYLDQYLASKGVKILAGQSVSAIADHSAVLEGGAILNCDMVIMAAGVRPNTELAQAAGIKIGKFGAIVVNEKMQTNFSNIYACGDCAESVSLITGRPLYRPLGSTANKMGRIAGDVMTGGSLAFRGILGTAIFRVFEMNVAVTGLREQEARDLGYAVVVSHNIKPDKPEYFGGREMVIKAIADQATGKILGVQIVGYEGVDKRIDVFVAAISAGMAAEDLFHLDLAYAPPFSTTKDPVQYTGMILDNAINRGRPLITADDLRQIDNDSVTVIDARIARQYAEGHVGTAVNLPHAELRDSLSAIDPEKTVVTYCNKGVTGNAAQNILLNRGFKKVYNLSGGFKQYKNSKKPPKGPVKP